MLKDEHPLVPMTQVSEPEADTSAVLGGSPDDLTEYLGDVEPLQLLGRSLIYSVLVSRGVHLLGLSDEVYLLLVVGLELSSLS